MTVATHLVTADFTGFAGGSRLNADVLIRDNVIGVAAATGLTPPLGYVGAPVKATVDNGVLLDASGSTGVVMTSNDAQLNLAGDLQYTFEFFDVKIDGVYAPDAIPNISYTAPTGSTAVDLIQHLNGAVLATMPVPQLPVSGLSDATTFMKSVLIGGVDAATVRSELGISGGNDWEPYANLAAFPATGNTLLEYVAQDTGKLYRWNGSAYIQVADKNAVGLGNVDNTSDAAKPVSTAQAAALATKATGGAIFDARDYGVVADGSPHNNVANLLDCFAQAYAAGAREVVLPAGVIDTSDAVIGTVTARSGATYTNNGGIPLPTGSQAVTITGHGKAVTTIKLSAGFPRAFDFWFGAFEQAYKGITLRDFTVDRDNLLGTVIAANAAVSSGVTLTQNTWVTLPGISATAFRNAQFVFFPATNAGTANTKVTPARISGSNVQVYNTSADLTLATADTVQGSMQGHVICGTWAGMYRVLSNCYIDSIRVENVDAVNVAESSAATLQTAAANRSAGIAMDIFNNTAFPPASTPYVTNFTARNVRVFGGCLGFGVWSENAGCFIDNVKFEDCFHDTMINPVSNWNSGNFLIGVQAWVNRAFVTRCVGRRSGDIAIEVDQPWEFYETDCTWEESYSGIYTTSFVPPARTPAGPPTTTLSASLADVATTGSITALPASAARAGLMKIDNELIHYSITNTAGTAVLLYRGLNGSTAAAHSNGAVVTFVETFKTRWYSTRSKITNKDVLTVAGGGHAYLSYTNSFLPLPPLTIRDAKAEFIGGSLLEGQFMYWSGWQPDLDMQGVRAVQDGLNHAPASGIGSFIAWDWAAGQSMALGSVPTQPRIFGRNNEFRCHGSISASSFYSVLRPKVKGYARFDFDLTADVVMAGSTSGSSANLVSLQPSSGSWPLAVAPGSRLGIKARVPVGVSTDFATRPIYVPSTSACTIMSMLDVDVDAYEMDFASSTGDTNYFPWAVDSTNVGKVRFGKVGHSLKATGKYPTAKKLAVSVNADYTVGPDDVVILVDTSSNPVTITLPLSTGGASLVGEPITRGREIMVKDAKRTAGTNTITITPASTDKVDGGSAGASIVISTNGGHRELASVPSWPGWATVGRSSDGPETTGPNFYTPGYISGQYYFCNSMSQATTIATPTLNRVRVSPFIVSAPLTISKLFAEFTVAGDAACILRLGVWRDDGQGRPGVLLFEAGSISLGSGNAGTVATGGTPGVYEIPVSQTILPGMYWVGGVPQGGATQPTLRAVNFFQGMAPTFTPVGTSLPAANYLGGGFYLDGVSGALGSLAGVSPGLTTAPRIGFKVA
jgi:hypothetical protein